MTLCHISNYKPTVETQPRLGAGFTSKCFLQMLRSSKSVLQLWTHGNNTDSHLWINRDNTKISEDLLQQNKSQFSVFDCDACGVGLVCVITTHCQFWLPTTRRQPKKQSLSSTAVVHIPSVLLVLVTVF